MSQLRRETVQAAVNIITPYVVDEGARAALVQSAFMNTTLPEQINMSGPASIFAIQLVTTCGRYGTIGDTSALVVLLMALRPQLGTDKQAALDALVARVNADLSPE